MLNSCPLIRILTCLMALLQIAKPNEIGLDGRQLEVAWRLLKKWTDAGDVPGAAIVVGRRGKIVEPQFFGRQGPEKNA